MDTLAAAEQLWKQGDHDGAWLALEQLEPTYRVMPEVLAWIPMEPFGPNIWAGQRSPI